MPSGEVAPGWVLPTWGLGNHQVAARPCGAGRSVASVPMKGSTSSSAEYRAPVSAVIEVVIA